MAAPKKTATIKTQPTAITVPDDVIDEVVAPSETIMEAQAEAEIDDVELSRFHEVLEQVRFFVSHLVPNERLVTHALLNELQSEYEAK